jgi:hypothetical protein
VLDEIVADPGRVRPGRHSDVWLQGIWSAQRFCRASNKVRNFLRPATYINQTISPACRRVIHVQRVAALRDLISVALYSLFLLWHQIDIDR